MHRVREDTAERHMVARVPTARPEDRAGRILTALPASALELTETIFVVAGENRLTGTVSLPRLLGAAPETRMGDLAAPVVSVLPETDQEVLAHLAISAGLDAVPVVDRAGVLLGAVPARALLAVLQHEHEEDLRRLAGIRRGARGARDALDASPARRVQERLPWLLVGLAGSVLSAVIMARFEGLLQASLAVAFFVPAIVYLADAIGTQTEAVVVRGLSIAHRPLGRLLAIELATGAALGLLTGLLAFPAAAWLAHDVRIALAVGVTLTLAGGMAAGCGTLLPWVLSRVGWDPAFGSGPVATIVQDIASLAIYLLVVSYFVGVA